MSEDDFEILGQLSDRLDSAVAGGVLPLPDRLHKEGLLGICGDIRDELRTFLIGKGFNPWGAA